MTRSPIDEDHDKVAKAHGRLDPISRHGNHPIAAVHESVVDVVDGARTTSPLSSRPTECGYAYRKKPVVIAIGDGASFAKGRDFAAWLGLVPRQMSTGDRTEAKATAEEFIARRTQMAEQKIAQGESQAVAGCACRSRRRRSRPRLSEFSASRCRARSPTI